MTRTRITGKRLRKKKTFVFLALLPRKRKKEKTSPTDLMEKLP
jgi:hypothetical protein